MNEVIITTKKITLILRKIPSITILTNFDYFKVNHMMRRLKLNFYRAEDEMFIMKKKQWRVWTIWTITVMIATTMMMMVSSGEDEKSKTFISRERIFLKTDSHLKREDEEFAREQQRRAKERHERRVKSIVVDNNL